MKRQCKGTLEGKTFNYGQGTRQKHGAMNR